MQLEQDGGGGAGGPGINFEHDPGQAPRALPDMHAPPQNMHSCAASRSGLLEID